MKAAFCFAVLTVVLEANLGAQSLFCHRTGPSAFEVLTDFDKPGKYGFEYSSDFKRWVWTQDFWILTPQKITVLSGKTEFQQHFYRFKRNITPLVLNQQPADASSDG